MDNESYKNALIEIRKSFDSMKSFREINFDYVLCSDILDIVKGIYEDAVNRGINKVDILYIMDYYNTEKEKFNYVYPEERKKLLIL